MIHLLWLYEQDNANRQKRNSSKGAEDQVQRHMLISQHAAIVAGLRAHDAAQAQEAVRSHLREINLSFGTIRERNPDWFEAE